MKPIKINSLASKDYAEALLYYNNESPEKAQSFIDNIDSLLQAIQQHPRLFNRVRGNVRRYFKKPFPYAIYYYEEQESINIVAITHMRRDSSHWMDRITKQK